MPRRDFLFILSGSALFVAIALSGGLFSYSPSSLPAAVSSLSSPSSSPLGSFTIQNAGRVTPISITGFSLSPPSLSALSVSGFNNLIFSSSDNLYRLTNPISLTPQASSALTLYLDPATTPSSLHGSRISLSSVSYQANNSNYSAPASLSFTVPAALGSISSAVSSLSDSNKNLRDLATCTPTASSCDADARSRVSNLINALDNKDNLSERSLITYVPDSPNAWRSVADNIRLGTSYEDIARALPDILRTQNISIPDSISALAAARSYACSTGLSDSRFLELQNLSLRRRQLELIKSRGYDLELRDGANNTSFLSTGLSACVRQPSYAGGTYEDVLYYLPTGECKTAVKAAATAALAATNSQIATARLRLFTDGFIDSSGLGSAEAQNTTQTAQFENYKTWMRRCSSYLDTNGARDGLSEEQIINKKFSIYGPACDQAFTTYRRFNPEEDAPPVRNIAGSATFRDTSLSAANHPDIFPPVSRTPLGGFCTGITNHVNFSFSNAKFVGGNCRDFITNNPQSRNGIVFREGEQCIEIHCDSYNDWVDTAMSIVLEQNPNIHDEAQLKERVWRLVGANQVCDLSNTFSENIAGVNYTNIYTNARRFISDTTTNSGNTSSSNNFEKILFNLLKEGYQSRINDINNALIDMVNVLIDGYTVNISVGGYYHNNNETREVDGHAIFSYACSFDEITNDIYFRIFDSNNPEARALLYRSSINSALFHNSADNETPLLITKFRGPVFANLNSCR